MDNLAPKASALSKMRNASRGISWTLGCQLITSIGQFAYSGVTARMFTPAEFGGFAAALSLMSVLALLTTTGLPAYVLKEPSLGKQQILHLRLLAALGGLATAAIFLVLAPLWLSTLNADVGMVFLPLLTVGQALGPSSAVESALLRRELQPKRDALSLLTAFLVANFCAVAFALAVDQAWTLALAVAMQPILLAIMARLLQVSQQPRGGSLQFRSVFGFTRRITVQNVGFLLLQRLPEWAISGVLGAAALGQFSKGASLSQMPATALSSALNRVVQPHWRFMPETDVADKASRDAALLAAGISFPVFGIVAANATTIVDLWLGPGWKEAGLLASYVAVGAGLSVPFGVIANGYEMRSNFRPVRCAQWCMLLALIPPLGLLAWTREIHWAAVAFVVSQLVAISVVVLWPSTARMRLKLAKQLLAVALWTAFISASGVWASQWLTTPGSENQVVEDLTRLTAACCFSLFLWLVTFRWHETNRVLQRRGFKIPKLLGGTPAFRVR